MHQLVASCPSEFGRRQPVVTVCSYSLGLSQKVVAAGKNQFLPPSLPSLHTSACVNANSLSFGK